MRFKIIALDLDGTALDSREAIRPRTKAAVASALARGVEVALVALVQTLEVEPSGGLELDADHAESTAFQISGAVLFLMPSVPSLN